MTGGPLIVQSDKTLLLEVDHEGAEAARRDIAPFAELERAPEHIHTYRVTPLGLWNARAAGHDAEQVIDALLRHSRYAVPQGLLVDIAETMARYGRLTIEKDPAHGLVLRTTDRPVLEEVLRHRRIEPLLGERVDPDTILVHPSERGHLKQQLLKIGWPAEDLAGYVNGEAHPITLREDGWVLRPYQRQAVEGFWHGGSGVVVLPCGAGKTIVGAGAMAAAGATTLILVTNTVAARQWKDELLRRTSLTEKEIGEYSGTRKEIRPVTIATYQVLSVRRRGVYPHLELLDARDWGLVVYDEVHLLPAPIFRMTADLQARRRLGLTATLVREDGREGRRLLAHRPQALRRAVEGHRGAGLDRSRGLRRSAGHARAGRADGVCRRRGRRALSARLLHPREGAGRARPCGTAYRRADSRHRAVSRPTRHSRRAIGRASDHRGNDGGPSGNDSSRRSGPARSGCWSSARWPTSRSTCLRRRWRSRCLGPSGHARRRLNVSAGCCGPRATGGRRTSTRSSRATPSTPTMPRIGNGSLAEQGYAYRIVDADDLSQGPDGRR
jgi:hypothetical protein